MDNSLVRYAAGDTRPARADKEIAVRAKQAYDEVRMTALKADGALALAGHMMEGLVQLDAKRQALSNGDPVTNALLSELEASAVRQLKDLQSNLYNGWRL